MPDLNVFDLAIPDGRFDVSHAVGGEATTMFVYDVRPGESSCPYHYEYKEEWLLVLDGALVVRAPEGERTVTRGDLVCFPPGPAGAHKVTNRSDTMARMIMFSTSQVPTVSVYPDSDKIGVWPGEDVDSLIFKRGSAVSYDEGEDGEDTAS